MKADSKSGLEAALACMEFNTSRIASNVFFSRISLLTVELFVLSGKSFLLLDSLLIQVLHFLQFSVGSAKFALGSFQFYIQFVNTYLIMKTLSQIGVNGYF